MTTNKPKLLFVIPQELLDRIDNFRFDNRINSRSEAVRRLIESGLESAKPKAKKKYDFPFRCGFDGLLPCLALLIGFEF
jgi:hypothetical protein